MRWKLLAEPNGQEWLVYRVKWRGSNPHRQSRVRIGRAPNVLAASELIGKLLRGEVQPEGGVNA